MPSCGTCYADVPTGATFCPECGAKSPAGKATAAPIIASSSSEVLRCASCGTELPAGARFCPECGGKPAETGTSSSSGYSAPPPAPAPVKSTPTPAPATRATQASALVGRAPTSSGSSGGGYSAPSKPEPSSSYDTESSSSSGGELKAGLCHGCGKQIEGRIVTAMDRQWHPDCFKCAGCGSLFASGGGGGSFMIKDDRPYCNKCTAKQLGVCAACGGQLSGPVLTALDRSWHPQCFVCGGCKKPFSGGKFKLSGNRPGVPFCDTCVTTA